MKRKKIFQMFKQTSKNDIKEILKKFKKDFELCGYTSTLELLEKLTQN